MPVIDELLSLQYRVIVVDDGSTPPLASLVGRLPVILARHRVNLGQGAAIQTGIELALERGAAYIATFDADGQHAAADIEKMLDCLVREEVDVVLGSRFLGHRAAGMPFSRKLLLQLARYVNFCFTGLLLTDVHNGLRVMSARAASSIRISENGMSHASEIISQVRQKRLRFREMPVSVFYTEYSLEKGQSARHGFRILFDLLLSKFFK